MARKMTYKRVMKTGRQIISMPILGSDEEGNWTPYGIAISLGVSRRKNVIEIHYINHQLGATCPYADIFGNPLDPLVEAANPYSHHIIREKEIA